MVWKCEICLKTSKQKKHHDEHLNSKTHKQKVEIFKLNLMHKDENFIIKYYPEFKDNYKNKEDLVDKIIDKKTNVKQTKKAIKSQTILDFIKDIHKYLNFEDILKQIKFEPEVDSDGDGIIDKSTRGFYYERLWDICIKFGLTELTLNTSDKTFTTHINTNTNVEKIVPHRNFWSKINNSSGGIGFKNGYLLDNVRSGNSGGYSDITFLNTNSDGTEDLYLISVKYYEKPKSIKDYDIPELCALEKFHKKDNRNIHVFIFVKDKKEVIDKFKAQNISSDILIKYINPGGNYENIYDTNDLQKCYFKLRALLEQYNYFNTDVNINLFESNYLKNLKQPFIPRFHQKLFIETINDLIINKQKNGVLVGAIPRSGKSYIMAGSILEYVKIYDIKYPQGKKLNFLMITPAPNETFGEYTDIFQNYIDFQNNNIECKVFRDKINSKDLDKTKHNVIIVSKQKLGWAKPGTEGTEKIDAIKKKINDMFKDIKNEIELMYLDEAHFGMSTEKSMQILNTFKTFGKKIPKIYVTATYNKPLKIYGIQPDCKLTWDVNDINIMKNLNESNIKNNPIRKRYGSIIYDKTLEWFGSSNKNILKDIHEVYSIFPKPHLITSLWHRDKLNIEKSKIGNSNYGFDMSKLFMTKNKSFENPEQIYEMLRYYFGNPDKSLNYDDRTVYTINGIIPRIKNMCKGKCRTMQNGHMTSQIWFLPVGSNGLISDKVVALLEILNDSEFRKLGYHYYCAVEVSKPISNNYVTYMKDSHKIKQEIENLENDIKEGNKGNCKNLIILTGNRLQLGISLRNVDIVVMWNSIESTDAIFQMLFRSMTEVNEPECSNDDDGFCKQKKWGFMVDLNPQRAMTNVNLFSENINYTKQDSDKIKEYKQIIDLIDIDGDIINTDEDNKDEMIQDLFNKLYESWDRDVENIKKITENFSYSPAFISQIEKQLRLIKFSDKTKKIIIQEAEEKIDPGKKKEKISEKDKKQVEKEKKLIVEIPIEKLAAELVAELISLLNIFTLYFDGNSKCILLNEYKKNQNVVIMSDISKLKDTIFSNEQSKQIFLKILNGRLGGNENEEYSEDVVNKIIQSISDTKDISYMEKIIFSQKKQYYGIREPDKLLVDINNNLAPKDKERKEKGEVFTPIKIVEEMLDKLPPEVWTNPNLKWLDPAVGIGNFPVVVYIRLMKSLEYWEPDEEKRRKHIIEKMLYMIEVSEKSIFILNKVFCGISSGPGGQYKLNIFHGSFVENKDTKEDVYKLFETFEDGTTHFDIVMGNPPYQFSHASGNPVYQHFALKGMDLLKENGKLCLIIPVGWKKYFSGDKRETAITYDKLKKYQIYSLNMNIEIDHFPPVDYFVIIKNVNIIKTNIICNFNNEIYKSNITINELPFIPLLLNDITIKIINYLLNKKGPKIHFKYPISKLPESKDRSKIKKDDLIYPHIHLLNNKGIGELLYFKNKKDIFNNKKIIVNILNTIEDPPLYPFIDDKGEYGTTQRNVIMVGDNNTIMNVKYLLDSKLIKFILKITQYSSGMFKQNEYKILNLITYPDIPLKTDQEIYDYYGINKSEQQLIEDIVEKSEKPKPKKKDKKTISKKSNTNNSSSNIKTPVKQPSKSPVKTPIKQPSNPKSSTSKSKDKYYDKKLKCEAEGKLWNPETKRCLKDTPANRKKLKLTLKKTNSKSNTLHGILDNIQDNCPNISLEIEDVKNNVTDKQID